MIDATLATILGQKLSDGGSAVTVDSAAPDGEYGATPKPIAVAEATGTFNAVISKTGLTPAVKEQLKQDIIRHSKVKCRLGSPV